MKNIWANIIGLIGLVSVFVGLYGQLLMADEPTGISAPMNPLVVASTLSIIVGLMCIITALFVELEN